MVWEFPEKEDKVLLTLLLKVSSGMIQKSRNKEVTYNGCGIGRVLRISGDK